MNGYYLQYCVEFRINTTGRKGMSMTDRNMDQSGLSPATGAWAGDGQAERNSLKTILMGGAAAGALGGLLVLLAERGKKDEPEPVSPLEQARMAIAQAAHRAASEGETQGKKAKKRSQKMSRKARKEQERTQANIMSLLAAARDDVRGTVSDARRQAPDISGIMNQARAGVDEAAKDARKKGKKLGKQVRESAQDSRKEAVSFVDMLRDRVSDVEHLAESYAESTLLPKLREFEKDASERVESGRKDARKRAEEARKHLEKDVLPQARKQAESVRKTVEDDVLPEARERMEDVRKKAREEWIPQAKDTAEELRKRAEQEYLPEAREMVGQAKVTLQKQADAAAESLQEGAEEASRRLSEVSETAKEQAHEAGEAVKRGGRESRSLLIWLALAGTIVYKVFLNEDQQKKVRETGMQIFGEAKEIYGDMKGHA